MKIINHSPIQMFLLDFPIVHLNDINMDIFPRSSEKSPTVGSYAMPLTDKSSNWDSKGTAVLVTDTKNFSTFNILVSLIILFAILFRNVPHRYVISRHIIQGIMQHAFDGKGLSIF